MENISIFKTLVFLLVFTFLIWYLRYHWQRRKLYQMAWQRPGLPTLPLFGNALYFLGSTQDILSKILNLVQKFESPVPIWLGSKLYFCVWKPEDLKIILNSPHALAKDEIHRYIGIGVRNGLLTAPVPIWKRHRKIITPTLNQKVLDGFVEVFSQESEILLEQLQKEEGQGIFNIFPYLLKSSVDIICETTMGTSVHAQTGDWDYFCVIDRGPELVFKRLFNVLYHFDFIFNLSPLSKELNELVRRAHSFTEPIIKEKKEAYQRKLRETRETGIVNEEPETRKNLLQLLIELSEESANFTDEELRDEVNTFTIAGSKTTASMESFVFIILAIFPDIQQKLYEEAIEVLGSDGPVHWEDLGKLEYLERVIKETLRLFPAGPVLTRAVSQDIKLEQSVIPGGCSVAMCIMGLHRDPKIWPDPLKFDPDRFLPEEVAKRHPYSWLAFSGGARGCIGIKFSYMAMKTTIAMVVRKYRIFTDYKTMDDIGLKVEIFLKPTRGFRVSLELR